MIAASLLLWCIESSIAAREPRVVFNDDAQLLMETPAEEATEFVKAWLDREIAAVPFTTYVFLAATPDICTYDSKQGETYGDRFGPEFSQSWSKGIRALREEGTDALKVVTEHMKANDREVLAAIRMAFPTSNFTRTRSRRTRVPRISSSGSRNGTSIAAGWMRPANCLASLNEKHALPHPRVTAARSPTL